MASKRAADQAFAQGDLVTAADGSDAPTPQVHKYADISPSKLPVPGHWPSSSSDLSNFEKDDPTRSTFLTQMGKWVLAQAIGLYHYVRPQRVRVLPIVRKDGARKKRIIDAGFADVPVVPVAGLAEEPPAPTPVLITRRTVYPRPTHFNYKISRGRGKGHSVLLPINASKPYHVLAAELRAAPAPAVAPAPAPAPIAEVANTPSPSQVAQDIEQLAYDDSLEFTFSDVIGSDTPPGCSATNAPVNRIQDSQAQQGRSPKVSQSARKRSRSIDEISPNSHLNIIRKSSVTPARKGLLKRQVYDAYVTEARKNHSAEAQAPTTEGPTAEEAYQAYYNHVETVDQDLSELPDAPPLEEDFVEEDDPDYRLKPRARKSVQWTEHAHAKHFYYDEAACDMLDSTLEAIHDQDSPARPAYRDTEHQDDSDDAHDTAFVGSPSSSQGQDSPQQSTTPGFTGVPDSTWEDSEESLSELQLSEELVSDLRDALDLDASAPPSPSPSPPPAPVKDLVTPISLDEQKKIRAAAVASNDGKTTNYPIIEDKITAHDFSTLLPTLFSGDPRAWLNDQIVNEYLILLTEEAKNRAGFQLSSGSAPPVHAFSSFFYTTLKKRPGGVARWAKRVNLGGKQYLDANLVLYPICDNGHWRLIAVKPKDRTIEYLDSMSEPAEEFIERIKGYLATELKEAWIEDEWTILETQRSTQQINGRDCGVFTILNALVLMQEKELTKVIATNGMSDARERIAVSLLARTPTTEFA